MKKKNLFKRCLFISALVIAILLVVLVMLRYEVEGEQKLPYKLSKILIISAEPYFSTLSILPTKFPFSSKT